MKKIILPVMSVLLCGAMLMGTSVTEDKKKPIIVNELAYEINADLSNQTALTDDDIATGEVDYLQTLSDVEICLFGRSKKVLSPDMAIITAKIDCYDDDMIKCKDDSFAIFDCVVDSLSNMGIDSENINIDFFSCRETERFGFFGRNANGDYHSSASFSVEVDNLEELKSCVDAISECGVNEICDISYRVSNFDDEYAKLLNDAVENAREKAETMLGVDNFKVVKIREERCLCKTSEKDSLTFEIEAQVVVEFSA